MDWKTKTTEEYDRAKDEIIEKVILHMRRPDDFDCPRLTQDEISVLISKDKDHVLSKMTICKDEIKAMRKMRNGLRKYGIARLEDVFNTTKGHTYAETAKTA